MAISESLRWNGLSLHQLDQFDDFKTGLYSFVLEFLLASNQFTLGLRFQSRQTFSDTI